MNFRFKALFGLTLLFAAGVATGVLLAPHFRPCSEVKPFPASEWIDTTLAEYRARLALDPEEDQSVHASVTAAAQSILKERTETQQRLRTIVRAMNSDILTKLDPDSRDRLQEWLEEKRAKLGGL